MEGSNFFSTGAEGSGPARDAECRLFAAAFENAPIGMALVGLDGQWLRVNRALMDLFGYTREEFLRKTFQDFTHPDDLDVDLGHVADLLCGKAKVYQMEKKYLDREGRVIWALLTATLVRDARGEPVHFISQILDITERKLLEQRFSLMQRMEGLDTRLQGIIRDLTASLTPMISEVASLRQQSRDAEVSALAGSIGQRAQQCLDLVQQILPHVRGETGQRVPLKIGDILSEVVHTARITAPQPLSLDIRLEENPWLVEGDRVQLSQAFLIFILNAREAIGAGEGNISLTATNVVIGPDHPLAEQAPTPGRYVVTEIADTGCGMTSDILARIFEPFFTTKTSQKGTGLGLPAAREIFRRYGGFLHVSSQPGQGTLVVAGLPTAKGSP